MADTTSSAPEGETPNQKQARLRREKRQKKMEEQGEDRLASIRALNGGVAPPEEVLGGPKPATVEDPDEVDISQTPPIASKDVNAKDNPLAAAMLQMQEQESLVVVWAVRAAWRHLPSCTSARQGSAALSPAALCGVGLVSGGAGSASAQASELTESALNWGPVLV